MKKVIIEKESDHANVQFREKVFSLSIFGKVLTL